VKTVALTAVIALLVLLGGGAPLTQELSTDIFPSEDEIYQALVSGDITYRQYLILAELAADGIDSSNAHLLDQIPNLSFFDLSADSIRSALEQQQLTAFTPDPEPPRASGRIGGSLSHRFNQYLEETGNSGYRTRLCLDYGKQIRLDLRLRREYSGYERVTGRTLTQKSSVGLMRKVTIGSYSQRIGMGTIFGYRGKLLSLSRNIDSESWLFPDFGGHNGIAIHLSKNAWDLQTVTRQRLPDGLVVRVDRACTGSACSGVHNWSEPTNKSYDR